MTTRDGLQYTLQLRETKSHPSLDSAYLVPSYLDQDIYFLNFFAREDAFIFPN